MTAPRSYDAMGILFRFHAFPGETMDKFCLVEAVVPPGLGAPPNHHAGETEAFYVFRGEIALTLGGNAMLSGVEMRPDSRSCTSSPRAELTASLLTLGRRAERSACHCAVVAR